jgi:aspartate aminotransferase
MSETPTVATDLTSLVQDAGRDPKLRISTMAAGLVGSEILKIGAEIRGLAASGKAVCDLTVGDFNPKYFPIPEMLSDAVRTALEKGETNYPPSNGMLELRKAVARFYARDLGLHYPDSSVLILGGARPAIYCLFRTVCDPGDRIVYPIPSWNNNHYIHMVGGVGVPVRCTAESRFMPKREDIVRALPGARMVCLNSPLNPTGTAIDRDALLGICEAILEENAKREQKGERPLYLMYDQIYWMLCFGQTTHHTPPELIPEMAKYTVFIDGISKAFAATGLRVGWAVGPNDLINRLSAIVGHVGAWAPRAEQVATAALLDDPSAIESYQKVFKHKLESRLGQLHSALQTMKSEGLAVDSIPPMGAIYLTARLHPFGKRTPQGKVLETNEDIRRYVLEASGIGLVPFQAFGATEDDGWFRMSVGAASEADITSALPRLATAFRALA